MTGQPDGVPTATAATRLGVSEKTIRRWIKTGKLHAYQVAVPQGYEWRIVLDDQPPVEVDTDAERADTRLVQHDRRLDSDRLRVVVEELQRTRERIEALEALQPEYGPHEPGPPVVLRYEEYPSEVESLPTDTPAPPGGVWARVGAWWRGEVS